MEVCENMVKKLMYVVDYFRFLKNPIQALLFKFNFKNSYEVKVKGFSETFVLTSVSALNRLMVRLPVFDFDKTSDFINYLKMIDNDCPYVEVDDVKYINIYNSDFIKNNDINYASHVDEYYSGNDWDVVNVLNRYVIDIGANVADSTLQFAHKGAKVIGFEPVKHLYELGVKNIDLNDDLKDNIIFINKAVGDKRGTLNIDSNSVQNYINEGDNYQIDVITIDDILNYYEFPADVLKMDCEGCEFEIILNNDLTMFDDIILEHHAEMVGRDYKLLIEKLENDGFKVNTFLPGSYAGGSFENLGIIHAFK